MCGSAKRRSAARRLTRARYPAGRSLHGQLQGHQAHSRLPRGVRLDWCAVAEERVRLEVRERTELGSAASRRLRRQGMVPGILYGRGKTPHAFAVSQRELRRVFTGGHGLHAILDVVLEGQKTTHPSILKDYQQDVVRGHLSHIDLHEVRLDQPIQAQIVVELVGEAAGTRRVGCSPR